MAESVQLHLIQLLSFCQPLVLVNAYFHYIKKLFNTQFWVVWWWCFCFFCFLGFFLPFVNLSDKPDKIPLGGLRASQQGASAELVLLFHPLGISLVLESSGIGTALVYTLLLLPQDCTFPAQQHDCMLNNLHSVPCLSFPEPVCTPGTEVLNYTNKWNHVSQGSGCAVRWSCPHNLCSTNVCHLQI